MTGSYPISRGATTGLRPKAEGNDVRQDGADLLQPVGERLRREQRLPDLEPICGIVSIPPGNSLTWVFP